MVLSPAPASHPIPDHPDARFQSALSAHLHGAAPVSRPAIAVPMPTQRSIHPGLKNEDQLRLGTQTQIRFILFVGECVDVQVKQTV